MTFKQKLKNLEAVEEGCVTLHCELSKPGVPVEWRKDAQLLTEGAKYQMKREGRVSELLISELTLADAAEYSCVAGSAVTSALVRVRGETLLHVWQIEKTSRRQAEESVSLCSQPFQ